MVTHQTAFDEVSAEAIDSHFLCDANWASTLHFLLLDDHHATVSIQAKASCKQGRKTVGERKKWHEHGHRPLYFLSLRLSQWKRNKHS